MTWYLWAVSNKIKAVDARYEIKRVFNDKALIKGWKTKEKIVLISSEEMQPAVVFYFSPHLYDLASYFKAQKCLKPKKDKGIKILIGDPDSMDAFFENVL